MTDSHPAHQVVVFVYSRSARGPRYLVIRQSVRMEGLWRPILGTVRPEEALESAAVREVRQDTGIIGPRSLVDFGFRHRENVGDLDLVEWGIGYDVGPELPAVKLAASYRDYQWLGFEQAWRTIEVESFREGVMKLHLQIAG